MATQAEPRTAQATAYVVLKQLNAGGDGSGPAWTEAGRAETATKQAAITQVAGDNEGIWRAVPVRSWSGAVQTRTEKITRTRAEVVED